MKIIAVANQKGGVAKTTSAVTLAHGAALRGYKTLLVDLDPQGNVGDSLGLPEGNDLIPLLEGSSNSQPYQARENLWVFRSDKNTAGYKAVLSGRDYREQVILDAFDNVRYDIAFLDCAPSIDVLHVAALTAADFLLVPSRLDQFAIKGVKEVLRTMAGVNRRGGRCKLAGILPTFYDRQTRETQEQLEHLAAAFGLGVWPMIPIDSQIREANREGQSLWEYSPRSRAVIGISGIGGGYLAALSRLLTLI